MNVINSLICHKKNIDINLIKKQKLTKKNTKPVKRNLKISDLKLFFLDKNYQITVINNPKI